jgi:hypothetical protein
MRNILASSVPKIPEAEMKREAPNVRRAGQRPGNPVLKRIS